MDNNYDDEFDTDTDDCDEDDGEETVSIAPSEPPTPKEVFQSTVSRITAALNQHDVVYPQLIAAVEPFDKKLAAKIRAAAEADMELLRYLQGKAERNEHPSLVSRIFGLLGG